MCIIKHEQRWALWVLEYLTVAYEQILSLFLSFSNVERTEWSCVMLSWLKILSCWPFSNFLTIIFLRVYIQAILHIYLFLCTWICPLKMLAAFSDLFSVTGKSDGCFLSPAVLNCWDKAVFAATDLTENKKLILYLVAFHCRNFLVLYVVNCEWIITDSANVLNVRLLIALSWI